MLSPTLSRPFVMYLYTEPDKCWVADKESWQQFNKDMQALKMAECAIEQLHMWDTGSLQSHEWDSLSSELFFVVAELERIAKRIEDYLG